MNQRSIPVDPILYRLRACVTSILIVGMLPKFSWLCKVWIHKVSFSTAAFGWELLNCCISKLLSQKSSSEGGHCLKWKFQTEDGDGRRWKKTKANMFLYLFYSPPNNLKVHHYNSYNKIIMDYKHRLRNEGLSWWHRDIYTMLSFTFCFLHIKPLLQGGVSKAEFSVHFIILFPFDGFILQLSHLVCVGSGLRILFHCCPPSISINPMYLA